MKSLNLKSLVATLFNANELEQGQEKKAANLGFKSHVLAGHGPTCGRDC